MNEEKGERERTRDEKMDIEWEKNQTSSEELIEIKRIENIKTKDQRDWNGNEKDEIKWRNQGRGKLDAEMRVHSDTSRQVGQLKQKEEEGDAILQRNSEIEQIQILEDKDQSNRKRKKEDKEVNKIDKKRLRDKQEKDNHIEGSEEKAVQVREKQVREKDTWDKGNNESELYEWESIREEYLVTIALSQKRTTTVKKNNLIRIYKIIIDSKTKFQGLKMVGFNRAEVSYKQVKDANDMIIKGRLKPDEYSAYIPNRWRFRRGVINEWNDSIESLEEQITEGQGVFTLERMKKRILRDGKASWEEGKSILIRMQGDSLPTKLLIGYGHVWLNVVPYVKAVKQCFRCLRFGHIQKACRAKERSCLICTNLFHGKCTENPKCINCKGPHTSLARECPDFQRESTIKKIMAFKNASYKEAEKMVKREERLAIYGNENRIEESEDEEDIRTYDFPTLKNKKRIEYWEKLDYPIEREIGKLKKVWERKREQRLFRREESPRRENTPIDNRRPTDNKWGHSSRILINNEEFRKNDKYKEEREKNGSQQPYHRTEDKYSKNKNEEKRGGTTDDNRGKRECKTLHYIPTIHNQANEEDYTPEKKGAPYMYSTEREVKAQERIRWEERKANKEMRDTTEKLKQQKEEELIEEIIKIIKEKDLLQKLKDRIEERQTRDQSIPIYMEEDWDCTREVPQNKNELKKNKPEEGIREDNEQSGKSKQKSEERNKLTEKAIRKEAGNLENRKKETITETEKGKGKPRIIEIKKVEIQVENTTDKRNEETEDTEKTDQTKEEGCGSSSTSRERDYESVGTIEWLEEENQENGRTKMEIEEMEEYKEGEDEEKKRKSDYTTQKKENKGLREEEISPDEEL